MPAGEPLPIYSGSEIIQILWPAEQTLVARASCENDRADIDAGGLTTADKRLILRRTQGPTGRDWRLLILGRESIADDLKLQSLKNRRGSRSGESASPTWRRCERPFPSGMVCSNRQSPEGSEAPREEPLGIRRSFDCSPPSRAVDSRGGSPFVLSTTLVPRGEPIVDLEFYKKEIVDPSLAAPQNGAPESEGEKATQRGKVDGGQSSPDRAKYFPLMRTSFPVLAI